MIPIRERGTGDVTLRWHFFLDLLYAVRHNFMKVAARVMVSLTVDFSHRSHSSRIVSLEGFRFEDSH